MTKEFFVNLNKTNVTSTWRDVCANGFHLEGNCYKADALFLDVPNPWAAITHAKKTLKKRKISLIKMEEYAVFLPASNKFRELATNSGNKNSRKYKQSNASAGNSKSTDLRNNCICKE